MEVRAPWHEPSYFFLPCWQDVSKLITFLIPQTTHILATTKSIMPHLERVPSEYSFPTPKNGLGTPSSMESSPPNAVSPDVKSTSNVVLQNRHQVRWHSIDTHVWTKDICRTYCKSEGPVQNTKEEECAWEGNHCLSPTKVVPSSR